MLSWNAEADPSFNQYARKFYNYITNRETLTLPTHTRFTFNVRVCAGSICNLRVRGFILYTARPLPNYYTLFLISRELIFLKSEDWKLIE